MKIKYTILFLSLLFVFQLISCEQIRYSYLGSIEIGMNRIWSDSNGVVFTTLFDDTDSIVGYDSLQIVIRPNYIIAKNNLPDFNIANKAFASKEWKAPIFQNVYTDIKFILMTDYNDKYKTGNEVFDLLYFGENITRANLVERINNKGVDAYDFRDFLRLGMRLKEPPTDTADFVLQIIIKDENGSYFHNVNRTIKVY